MYLWLRECHPDEAVGRTREEPTMSEHVAPEIHQQTSDGDGDGADIEHGELVSPLADGEAQTNSVTEPAKVMRIGSMVKQLLDEVRHAPLDQASRERLAEIYERSVAELSEALSPDLQEELRSLALPFDVDSVPT